MSLGILTPAPRGGIGGDMAKGEGSPKRGRARPKSAGPKVSPGRATPRFVIRLPQEYKVALETLAKKNLRPISLEILLAIRERLEREGVPIDAS